ncbi:MAG: response regulator [Epsilonproteobacteria bacterium]|nr:response regulator [Campylobacterota bacterium]
MPLLKELKKLGQNISILYVEDDKDLLQGMTNYLKLVFARVDTAQDGEEGLEKYSKNSYDIVITDIQMPKINGIEMIKTIRKQNLNQEILITTAFSEVHYLLKAIELDVNGYIVKPINFDKINATLYKVVSTINMQKENIRYKTKLEEMVEEKTAQNLLLQKEQIDNYEQTLLSLVELVEKRDTYTGGHSQRVATYSKMIAQQMNFSQQECELVYKAGILHDIGKIETPDAVLLNPGKLNKLEFSLIQEHVTTGANMLQKIPMYKELSKIIAQHHERHDGQGYPAKIKDNEILPLARIMIVADAFDAMTTNRIYKLRMSKIKALKELSTFSGTQFNPTVAKHAVEVFKDIEVDEGITQLPSTYMEEKKFAFFFEDQLTGAHNKAQLELTLIQNINASLTKYLIVLLLHNFSSYNKKYGWDSGNLLLKRVTKILQNKFGDCSVFRLEGDDFLILSNKNLKTNFLEIKDFLVKSGDIVQLEIKKFNTRDQQIKSTDDIKKLI